MIHPDGSVYICQYGGGFSILKMEMQKLWSKEGLSDVRIWDMDIDSEGNIWLATDGSGVFKFDGKSFTHYRCRRWFS